MIPALDISQYQGTWQDRGDPIVMIKMSGGDDGLYMDSQAASNYTGAVADGRAVGGYHFIGWTAGAVAEATYFMQAMSPLAENDVYALDIESGSVAVPANAPDYVLQMVNAIHDKIGVWPLVYMNLSTLNAHDWDAVLQNCGLWLGDWNNDPNATIATVHTYVMQQYSDGPNYDHDEWFGTVEEFKAYGYHAPAPATPAPPAPAVPTPVENPPAPVVPESSPAPEPIPEPVETTPEPITKVGPTPSEGIQNASKRTFLDSITDLLKAVLDFIKGKG